MWRLIFFILIMIIPAVLGWWLFIPLALFYVYFAKFPYELIVAGAVLDASYYFGQSFLWQHLFALVSLVLLIIAFFLDKTLQWQKRI